MKLESNILYKLVFKCLRCNQLRTIICGDSNDISRSNYIKILNYGDCTKNEHDGHVDCLYGCTHPPKIALIIRILLFPFQRKPIIGYCKLISKETISESHNITEWPDANAEKDYWKYFTKLYKGLFKK